MATQDQNLAAGRAALDAAIEHEVIVTELAESMEWLDGDASLFEVQRVSTKARYHAERAIAYREDARRLFVLAGMTTTEAQECVNA